MGSSFVCFVASCEEILGVGVCPISSKFAIAHTAFTFPICRWPCQFAAAPIISNSRSLTPLSAFSFQLSAFNFQLSAFLHLPPSSLRPHRTRLPFHIPLAHAAGLSRSVRRLPFPPYPLSAHSQYVTVRLIQMVMGKTRTGAISTRSTSSVAGNSKIHP